MGSDDGEEGRSESEEEEASRSEPSDGSESHSDGASEHSNQSGALSTTRKPSSQAAKEISPASTPNYKRMAANRSELFLAGSADNDSSRRPGRPEEGVEMQAICKTTDWTKSQKDTKLLRELSGKKGIDKLKHLYKETTGYVRKTERLTPVLTYAAQHALPFSLMEVLLVRHAGWDETNTSGPATLELLVGHARRAPSHDRDQWIGILATLFWIHTVWVKDIDAEKRAKYPPLFEFLDRNDFQGSQLIEWDEAIALAKDLILGVGLKKAPEPSTRMKRVATSHGRR